MYFKIKVLAGVDAVSHGYRRVASHRPQRGGHVSYSCLQYFLLYTIAIDSKLIRSKTTGQSDMSFDVINQ